MESEANPRFSADDIVKVCFGPNREHWFYARVISFAGGGLYRVTRNGLANTELVHESELESAS